MAILANTISAPIAQPFLRAAGPCRVLTDAEVIALTATSLGSVRDALAQTYPVLHRNRGDITMVDTLEAMYLPPLSVALSRRKALFGSHTAERDHA